MQTELTILGDFHAEDTIGKYDLDDRIEKTYFFDSA